MIVEYELQNSLNKSIYQTQCFSGNAFYVMVQIGPSYFLVRRVIAVPKVLVLQTLTVNSIADKSNNEEVT